VESFDSASARTSVSVVGGLTLLWGTSRIFRALDVAFSEIYSVEENKSVLAQARDAVIVAVSLVIAAVVVVAASAVVAVAPDLPYPAVVNPLLLVVGLSLAFYPVYYVFPDVNVRPIEVVPGTVFAAVGWTVLEAAFQSYVAVAGRYEAVYGTLGSAFLLLIWLYFSGLVLLVGGVLNAVLAGRTLDEHALGTPEDFEIDESAGTPDDGEMPDLPPDSLADAPREVRREAARRRVGDGQGGDARAEDGRSESAQVGDGPGERGREETTRSLGEQLAAAETDAEYRRLREEVERLAAELEEVEAENERLREERERLREERERLRRNNADLARRLERRRRSLRERVRGWFSRRRE
jgi:YihY family inner membrane protein